jgi:DMSO/TMAO reductase YedYZ heme-binding membrane subunit
MTSTHPTDSLSPPAPPTTKTPLWPIALAALATTAVVVSILRLEMPELERLVLLNRYLARLSFIVFVPIYAASPLAVWFPGPAIRGLLRIRRSLGLGYAIVMGAHVCGILAYHATNGSDPIEPVAFALGGLGFVLIAALAATSNDASVRRLGGRRWKRLHLLTLHWLWAIYAFTYLGRIGDRGAEYLPGLITVFALLALRMSAFRRRRRRSVA